MDKRTWINVGLLAFIIALSAAFLIPEDNTEAELPLLSNIGPKDIVRIEVLRKGLDDFIFNKDGEAWYMITPQQFLANNSRINAILRLLKTESYGQLNSDEVELARFELADPVITLKLNDHVFQFGNTDAIDQRRYVLFDKTIHLINDFLYQQLTTNAAFFADTKVLPAGFSIKTIEFPKNKIELQDNQWQLQSLMDIKPDQLKQIVSNWENVNAISVGSYNKPEIESHIVVTSMNDSFVVFDIVSTEPHLILGRKDLGIKYHLGSDETDKLLLTETPGTSVTPELPDVE